MVCATTETRALPSLACEAALELGAHVRRKVG